MKRGRHSASLGGDQEISRASRATARTGISMRALVAADIHLEALARTQGGVLADAVPAHQVADRDAEHLRDARQRVTATHLVRHLAGAARRDAGGPAARRSATRIQHELLA